MLPEKVTPLPYATCVSKAQAKLAALTHSLTHPPNIHPPNIHPPTHPFDHVYTDHINLTQFKIDPFGILSADSINSSSLSPGHCVGLCVVYLMLVKTRSKTGSVSLLFDHVKIFAFRTTLCFCVYAFVRARACVRLYLSPPLSLSLSLYIYIYIYIYIYTCPHNYLSPNDPMSTWETILSWQLKPTLSLFIDDSHVRFWWLNRNIQMFSDEIISDPCEGIDSFVRRRAIVVR